jgi:hypothetical protein
LSPAEERRLVALSAAGATALAVFAVGFAACSPGTGSGRIDGEIDVPACWSGQFQLSPDFFAAVPYRDTLQLRIQRGGDYETFSDGVEIQVDDITTVRSEYGQPLIVGLPAGVTPPGVPLAANPTPSIIHLALYLQATCAIQNVALYAVDAVSLDANGNCTPTLDSGAPLIQCPGSTSGLLADAGGSGGSDGGELDAGASDAGAEAGASDAGAPAAAPTTVGHSWMTFTSLFDGDPNEVSAAQRLTAATFKVYLADPREVCPGGVGPPPPCRGVLDGAFSFYFERGRPAQPFP